MTLRTLRVRDVVTASFPAHVPGGHEQEGVRPAIVVGVPTRTGPARFEGFVLVPLTSDKGQPWASANPTLYPRFPAGTAGLRSPSIALCDQVRGLDAGRISRRRGTLSPAEFAPLEAALRAVFEL